MKKNTKNEKEALEEQYQGESILLEEKYKKEKEILEGTLERKTDELKEEYDTDGENGSHKFGITSLKTLIRCISNKLLKV